MTEPIPVPVRGARQRAEPYVPHRTVGESIRICMSTRHNVERLSVMLVLLMISMAVEMHVPYEWLGGGSMGAIGIRDIIVLMLFAEEEAERGLQ
jgi:hypothetical protein